MTEAYWITAMKPEAKAQYYSDVAKLQASKQASGGGSSGGGGGTSGGKTAYYDSKKGGVVTSDGKFYPTSNSAWIPPGYTGVGTSSGASSKSTIVGGNQLNVFNEATGGYTIYNLNTGKGVWEQIGTSAPKLKIGSAITTSDKEEGTELYSGYESKVLQQSIKFPTLLTQEEANKYIADMEGKAIKERMYKGVQTATPEERGEFLKAISPVVAKDIEDLGISVVYDPYKAGVSVSPLMSFLPKGMQEEQQKKFELLNLYEPTITIKPTQAQTVELGKREEAREKARLEPVFLQLGKASFEGVGKSISTSIAFVPTLSVFSRQLNKPKDESRVDAFYKGVGEEVYYTEEKGRQYAKEILENQPKFVELGLPANVLAHMPESLQTKTTRLAVAPMSESTGYRLGFLRSSVEMAVTRNIPGIFATSKGAGLVFGKVGLAILPKISAYAPGVSKAISTGLGKVGIGVSSKTITAGATKVGGILLSRPVMYGSIAIPTALEVGSLAMKGEVRKAIETGIFAGTSLAGFEMGIQSSYNQFIKLEKTRVLKGMSPEQQTKFAKWDAEQIALEKYAPKPTKYTLEGMELFKNKKLNTATSKFIEENKANIIIGGSSAQRVQVHPKIKSQWEVEGRFKGSDIDGYAKEGIPGKVVGDKYEKYLLDAGLKKYPTREALVSSKNTDGFFRKGEMFIEYSAKATSKTEKFIEFHDYAKFKQNVLSVSKGKPFWKDPLREAIVQTPEGVNLFSVTPQAQRKLIAGFSKTAMLNPKERQLLKGVDLMKTKPSKILEIAKNRLTTSNIRFSPKQEKALLDKIGDLKHAQDFLKLKSSIQKIAREKVMQEVQKVSKERGGWFKGEAFVPELDTKSLIAGHPKARRSIWSGEGGILTKQKGLEFHKISGKKGVLLTYEEHKLVTGFSLGKIKPRGTEERLMFKLLKPGQRLGYGEQQLLSIKIQKARPQKDLLSFFNIGKKGQALAPMRILESGGAVSPKIRYFPIGLISMYPKEVTTKYPPAITTKYPPTTPTKYPPAITTKYPPAITTKYPPTTPTKYPPAITTKYPPTLTPTYPPGIPTKYPPGTPTKYPPIIIIPRKPKVPPKIIGLGMPELKKSPVEKARAYQTYIKERGKFKQFGKPTKMEEALDLGAEYTDRTPSARFKIEPTNRKPVRNLEANRGYYNSNKEKFREYKKYYGTKKKLQPYEYIEREGFRIDRTGEKKGIQAKGTEAVRLKKLKRLFGGR